MTDTVRIPEQIIGGQRLGRHVAHDPRSLKYPAETASTIKSVKHETVGLPLDQGTIGSCTANALCGALNSAPNFTGTIRTEKDAVTLYELETALEGEPYPPNDPGGTGLYVCRAAKQEGLVRYYRHAFGLDHALKALALRPIIIGCNWYEGFDSPDGNGLVKISGQVRGGHEIVATEIDAQKSLVWFWNSWGKSYGQGGRFAMSFTTLGQLLSEQGDATVPYV